MVRVFLKTSLSWFIIIFITILVYVKGLQGGFIFDDYMNLEKLSIINGNLSLENIYHYFAYSDAGPIKRPISIFSFLIDAQNWPAEAYSFKRTNLIIHLLNGSLLYLFLSDLFKYKNYSTNKSLYIAGFSALIWLVHPFFVSTTLYIVQRMAMLPLLFMLLGFIIYLKGRHQYNQSNGLKGKISLIIAVYLLTLLAVLSKENGIVFIWLVALFEVFIVQRYLQFKPLSNKMSLWLLKLPSIALILLFILQIPGFINGYDIREFSIGERLLSQTRAISKYLYHLILPGYFTEGVFTDGFKHSTNLFNPISTILSSLFILGLLTLAWIKRNKWIWFSFSVFFFFIAQVLESTIVPLELYYEHRVYVATIFLPVVFVLLTIKLSGYSNICLIFPVLISFLLAGYTYMRTDIWSNNLQLHQLTMNKYPDSARVRVSTASIYDKNGLYSDAYNILKNGEALEDLDIEFNKLAVACLIKTITKDDIEILSAKIKSIPFDKNDHRSYQNLINMLLTEKCMVDDNYLSVNLITDAMLQNPNEKFYFKDSSTYYIKAKIAEAQNNFDLAMSLYLKSFELVDYDYDSMLGAATSLYRNKQYEKSVIITDLILEKLHSQPFYKVDWTNVKERTEYLKETIISELNSVDTKNGSE